MSERILILGNMANDGYSVAKELVKLHKDTTLAVNNTDFGMSMPQWEENEYEQTVDPFHTTASNLKQKWKSPKWVRYFDFEYTFRYKRLHKRMINSLKVRKLIREHDIVEAHVPFSIEAMFSGIPYVSYDAGWIRAFEHRRNKGDLLGEMAYNRAKALMITNPDTLRITDILKTLHPKKVVFTPFAIDSNHYKPLNKKQCRFDFINDNDFIIFNPSRQVWNLKGNDMLFYAFARFLKIHPNSKLIAVLWSTDIQKSLQLVYDLGIADKVVWIPPVSKPTLIKLYNIADVVTDQFILGSWGTTTPEAMSCGKPVLMYYNSTYINRVFHSKPPIINCKTSDEIYNGLNFLVENPEIKEKIGNESREWIKLTHNPIDVARLHLKTIQQYFKK